MATKDALVKISGSVTEKEDLYQWLAILAKKYRLYILCGGGAAITDKLNEEKIPFKFKDGRRIIKSEEGRKLAAEALEKKRVIVENELRRRGIPASVFSPVIKFGDKTCHINGDHFVMMAYHNFSKVFVATSSGTNKDSLKVIKGIEIVRL